MAVTGGLKPERVFHYFEEICSIPHGSGNIDGISDYLMSFARSRDLLCVQDQWKNVIIIKEASEGYEDEAPIILQGHMDMVAVKKPDAHIDMSKDGLRLKIDGDYLHAQDTSLGGDDGIAIAYALAVLDSREIKHPRLEVILTVDEEVGMDGARELDVSMLRGKRMLNLDSDEEGIILAGCAGGVRADWLLPMKRDQQTGSMYSLTVKGLLGGHSGAEIDKERGNSNCIMGRVLYELADKLKVHLVHIKGGLADNAIPRETEAVIMIQADQAVMLKDIVKNIEGELREELQTKDPDAAIEVLALPEEGALCVCSEDAARLIYLLFGAPNGIQAMSAEIDGLVETSLNMGIVELKDTEAVIQFSIRSSLESSKNVLINKLKNMAATAGAFQEIRGDYPGWAYRRNSPFRDMATELYRIMFGREPEIQAIHAGLECGLLTAKIPGLECISIGPDMKDIHTTEERLSISSTERVWNYLLEILKHRQTDKRQIDRIL